MLRLFYPSASGTKEFSLDADDPSIASMIEHLRGKTGVYLDPYADSRLYPAHQALCIAFLRSQSAPHTDFIAFLQEAVARDEVVRCIGD